jgi:tetratricopeptide (TPR) repeat protein
VGRFAYAGFFAATIAALIAADGRASLFHPSDQTGVIPVDDSGAPQELPFDEFQRRRLILRNILNSDWPLFKIDPTTKQPVIDPNTGQPGLSERGIVDARIKKTLAKKPRDRTESERIALAIDLLRMGRPDEGALEGLRSGFLPNITLAHIAAAQGEWSRAYQFLDIANEEAPPAVLASKSAKLLVWQRKLDHGALLALVKLRTTEARKKSDPETEQPDHIWPLQFVNEAGEYQPGALAAAEKAKLPGGDFPEAIATVQQLVLWFPADVRLYWLLGELYAARGDLKAAKRVMDECVDSGRYSNRKVLMQHREVVTRLASIEPPAPEPPPPVVPFSMGAIWLYFGGVAAIALLALVRTLLKRNRSTPGACGPVG